jgi:hypothetical protein
MSLAQPQMNEFFGREYEFVDPGREDQQRRLMHRHGGRRAEDSMRSLRNTTLPSAVAMFHDLNASMSVWLSPVRPPPLDIGEILSRRIFALGPSGARNAGLVRRFDARPHRRLLDEKHGPRLVASSGLGQTDEPVINRRSRAGVAP